MYETTKTNRVRGEEFKHRYLSGRVIDIGCGADLVVPCAVPFDFEEGDAQFILRYFAPQTFDCVHSSHCLEHMRDVKAALAGWWALVKPGGHLIIVVPQEDIYEQGLWPSLFNPDHKATFRLFKKETWSPVSFDLAELIRDLPGAEIVEATVQDQGLDYRRVRRRITRFGLFLYKLSQYRRRRLTGPLGRRGVPIDWVEVAVDRLEQLLGKPIDQTLGLSLAQIQVVAHKVQVVLSEGYSEGDSGTVAL
jgi:SAM-dependent methyltransferase